jgi:hypothetical protein
LAFSIDPDQWLLFFRNPEGIMSRDTGLEATIWDYDPVRHGNQAHQLVLAQYLVAELGEALPAKLLIEDTDIRDNYFRVWVRSEPSLGGLFQLSYKGLVVGSLSDKPDEFSVAAILFLFSFREQLRQQTRNSFMRLVYDKSDDGWGHWRSCGWFCDEHEEYDSFHVW